MPRAVSRSSNNLGARNLRSLLSLGLEIGTDIQSIPGRSTSPAKLMKMLTTGTLKSGHDSEELLAEILSPTTSLLALYRLKEVAKRLIDDETGSRSEAATLLYLAAIAQGLARHGKNISSVAPTTRTRQFGKLAEWFAGGPLGSVFRAAELASLNDGKRRG
jgi:hypothetical protein